MQLERSLKSRGSLVPFRNLAMRFRLDQQGLNLLFFTTQICRAYLRVVWPLQHGLFQLLHAFISAAGGQELFTLTKGLVAGASGKQQTKRHRANHE